jgi:hypothetical protein
VFLDEVPGMLEAFGNDAKRSHLQPSTTEHGVSPPQSGTIHFQTRRNRGKREQQKKAQLNPKEKRKLKKEKKK